MSDDRKRPLLLRADNFTPPSRTPWGGTRILSRYKNEAPLAGDKAAYPVVGESWEISVEPDFPSRVDDTGEPLSSAIGSTALLVKLLDAAEPLSVQIHPSDDYGALAADESGKPESWYVLEAEPGAGLYLGLREGVGRAQMADALEHDEDVSALLGFVPVAPGDFFVIDAGTAHAIGPGITLVEPQRVLPGRRGLTYRYWDWNRRYDGDGKPDPDGEPRTLHVREALDVTAWDAPREDALLERIRIRAGAPETGAEARLEPLGGPDGPVRFDALRVERLSGSGSLRLEATPWLRGITVADGAVTLRGEGFDVRAERGRSVALPAGLACDAELEGAHAVVAAAD